MGTLLFLRVFGAVALLGVLLTLGAGVGASQLAPNAPPLTLLSGPLSPRSGRAGRPGPRGGRGPVDPDCPEPLAPLDRVLYDHLRGQGRP